MMRGVRLGGSTAALTLPCLLLSGCVLSDVDLKGKECPCGPGYWCDETTFVCMRGRPNDDGGGLDAPGRDGGSRDSGSTDAGGIDAGGIDAGGVDAGATDSGGIDAGPRDAGRDGGRDAGTDSGPPDAGRDAGPDPTSCDDILMGAAFCDGFEDVGLTAWPDQYGTGSLSRTTTSVYRGAGALRVSTTAGSFRALEKFGIGGLDTDVYIRGYVFVPSGFSLVDVGMMYTSAGGVGMGFGVETGGRPYVFVDEAGMAVVGSTVTVPRDAWTCMRAHIVVSDTSGSVEIWVNDDLAASRSGLDTRAGNAYSSFSAGITYSNPSGGDPTVFLDEVAIDSSPLPCD